jgi:hypothetical protein
MLNKIPFYCGVNQSIFEHLKKRVDKMSNINKFCILFDEVSLSLGLHYCSRRDSVHGFFDYGGANRRLQFADHALAFIVKGIHKKWKQVVWYSFCKGTTPTADLRHIIKTLVDQLPTCGLNLVATISDQGSTNRAAVHQLILDTRRSLEGSPRSNYPDPGVLVYEVNNCEVVHLYDFPHLIKCIRNLLLGKDLHFVQGGIHKKASWCHVLKLHEMDEARGPFSQFIKLTDEHVLPSKIKKMKVKNCTQVFSHSVATAMNVAARTSFELSHSEFYLDPKATETADLLMFFDTLFDSVNGTSLYPLPGKELRSVVTKKSQLIEFWKSCLPILSSMYFTEENSDVQLRPSCLKNWVASVRGMIHITDKLFQNNFRNFPSRCFNQDPVEIFFSCIRSYGIRNTNPTCTAFAPHVKHY